MSNDAQSAPLSENFIQTVPDKCDRIVWRGRYYHLPLSETVAKEPEDYRSAVLEYAVLAVKREQDKYRYENPCAQAVRGALEYAMFAIRALKKAAPAGTTDQVTAQAGHVAPIPSGTGFAPVGAAPCVGADSLTPKEGERLQRLRDYAYQLQNRLDGGPIKYEMGFTRARLSALKWAVEKISGIPFSPESMRPAQDAEAAALSEERQPER